MVKSHTVIHYIYIYSIHYTYTVDMEKRFFLNVCSNRFDFILIH